jgi:tetratricopeptide (TPR) repeat protein
MTDSNRRDAAPRPLGKRPTAYQRRALQIALIAVTAAEVRQRPTEMAHALAEVSRCLITTGDLHSAQAYLEQALHWAAALGLQAGADELRADLLCTLAEVACQVADLHDDGLDAQAEDGDEDLPAAPEPRADREQARDHAIEAAVLAGRGSDPMWEVKLLLRASDVLDRCGEHDDAVAMQNRAMALMGLMKPEPSAVPAIAPSRDALRVAGPSSLM